MEQTRQSARNVVSFLTGFGPFMKHLMLINPTKYKSDECQICFEGGSEESPQHLLFECKAMQWDRNFIFGQHWPLPTDRPILASLSKNHGGTAQAIQLQASQLINPANSALAGRVSQVSTSSSNVPHPLSFSEWTIKQIHEFVSIDSLTAVYVTHYTGESDLKIKAASTNVHVAPI